MGRISLHLENFFADRVGEKHGIRQTDWDALALDVTKSGGYFDRLMAMHKGGELAFVDLLRDHESVKRYQDLADEMSTRFENIVVLGIGGSALGGLTLFRALSHPYHNQLSKKERGGSPRIFFCDNIDPAHFVDFLQMLDLSKTAFNVISKSGNTTETLAQFLIAKDMLRMAIDDDKISDHFVVTTDPKTGHLRALREVYDFEGLSIPPLLGGRFSALSAVGLFPSACAGIQIDQVLEGAKEMEARSRRREVSENPVIELAMTHFLLDQKSGKHSAVMMPYCEALGPFTEWYCQLHAESLGKNSRGQTPICARGVSDQHSQLQLYLEGPNDKMIMFLKIQEMRHQGSIPPLSDVEEKYSGLSLLKGHSLARLLHAELEATRHVLTEAQRPNGLITLSQMDPHALGGLLFLYEMQTTLLGLFYGVNPFDQPAVERGKIKLREILSTPTDDETLHDG